MRKGSKGKRASEIEIGEAGPSLPTTSSLASTEASRSNSGAKKSVSFHDSGDGNGGGGNDGGNDGGGRSVSLTFSQTRSVYIEATTISSLGLVGYQSSDDFHYSEDLFSDDYDYDDDDDDTIEHSETISNGGGLSKSKSMSELSRKSSIRNILSAYNLSRSNSDAFLLKKARAQPSIFHFKGEKLPLKNVSLELQARQDLLSVSEAYLGKELRSDSSKDVMISGLHKIHPQVLMNVSSASGDALVDTFARELVKSSLFNVTFTAEDGLVETISEASDPRYAAAMRLALSRSLMHSTARVQSTFPRREKETLWKCDTLYGRGFTVLTTDCQGTDVPTDMSFRFIDGGQRCSISLVPKRKAKLRAAFVAKLKNPTTLGSTGHLISFVVLVLVVGNHNPAASHLSTGHTFATLLTNEKFYVTALRSRNQKHFCEGISKYVKLMMLKQEAWLEMQSQKDDSVNDADINTTLQNRIMSTKASSKKIQEPEEEAFRKPGDCCPVICHAIRARAADGNRRKEKEVKRAERIIERQLKRAKRSSLAFSGHFLGLFFDISRLRQSYIKGWIIGKDDLLKLFSGTLWQLFATTAPAISIGLVYNKATSGGIGVTEMLISEGV